LAVIGQLRAPAKGVGYDVAVFENATTSHATCAATKTGGEAEALHGVMA
jgi:hypothetical protein